MSGAPAAVSWDDLVGVGLLGTDRRRPPVPDDPAIAELVDDALAGDDARRLLVTVAATVVAQRSGLLPAAARRADVELPADRRPMISAAAAALWRRLVETSPLLEPEWFELAVANGWRPSPDVLVDLLRRARNQPVRHAAVMRFGGAVAEWLVEVLPELQAVGRPTRAVAGDAGGRDVSAVPPELLACFQRGAGELCDELIDGMRNERYTWPQRLTLHHALAELPAAWLPEVAAALGLERERLLAAGPVASNHALCEDLSEFAAVRRAVLAELEIVR